MAEVFDVVVVGAGITGTCAAYHAQLTGLRTLLIEQNTLGHHDGSSAGKSRIIRYAHNDGVYIPIARESFKQIGEMEKKRGEKLWIKTGLVWIAERDEIQAIADVMAEHDCESEIITTAEVTRRYPQFVYGNELIGLVDPMGGVILADKWIRAYQEEFAILGGRSMELTTVHDVKEQAGIVTLQTSRGVIRAKKSIIAVGTWINKLIPDFPIQSECQLISVSYWKPKRKEDEELMRPDRFPVILATVSDAIGYYGLPSVDYEGAIKFAFHEGEVYEIDKEPVLLETKMVEGTRQHLAKYLPIMDTENGPFRIDRCKYSMSPDQHYILDRLPGSNNIIVCGCLSGTGFKAGPALGKVLTEMMQGRQPSLDVSAFSLKRFKNKSKI